MALSGTAQLTQVLREAQERCFAHSRTAVIAAENSTAHIRTVTLCMIPSLRSSRPPLTVWQRRSPDTAATQ
jgi:hypothetical protein